jgi:hypothetical protein
VRRRVLDDPESFHATTLVRLQSDLHPARLHRTLHHAQERSKSVLLI